MSSATQDHPRVCGEKDMLNQVQLMGRGSPPHVRGKDSHTQELCDNAGITPACAGKRFVSLIRVLEDWDHPRMCGEKPQNIRKIVLDQGSPPHVRGKVSAHLYYDLYSGITPACAGKRLQKP